MIEGVNFNFCDVSVNLLNKNVPKNEIVTV